MKDGTLRNANEVAQSLETGGDVFETVEEMYGMIWFLAATYAYSDPKRAVDDARSQFREGLHQAEVILSGR